MNKTLTRTEYLMSFLFIFMLVCAVAAFFFGYKVGADRTKVRYEAQLAQQNETPEELTAYHQQYLVSFYHTVFSPFQEFRGQWFGFRTLLESGASQSDPSKSLQDLSKLAETKYQEMVTFSVPSSSPKLKDAHERYLKSLKLFEEAAKSWRSKANSTSANQLLSMLDADNYIKQAVEYGLEAQAQYYEAILLWNDTVQPVSGRELLSSSDLSIKEWNQLALNAKNQYVSALMLRNHWFLPIQTMDLSARMDDMIASGQAAKLNIDKANALAELIVQTGAVREGDFVRSKDKFYAQQTLPQLPFFFARNQS